jgi:opacity protein-like surface antigen
MRKFMLVGVSLFALGLGLEAKAADIPLQVPQPSPLLWSWTGGYIGAHLGAEWGTTDLADPFGTSIFGDKVRTPGFLAGGQIGFNWQAPGSPWVFGVEADISGLDSGGTNTCFAVSAITVNTTCQVRPQATGTLTGRVGYALGPSGRTLIYGKGGLAFANDKIDMALNSAGIAFPGVLLNNSQTVTLWGGTLGAGIEQALTPAWSLKVEYDYLGFGSRNIANLGNFSFLPDLTVVGVNPPGTSGVTQNIQQLKVGLNYKFGADPWGVWPAVAPADPVNAIYGARPTVAWAAGWEVEAGGRYFGSWGQFHKDLGLFINSGFPSMSGVSRLTYDEMRTNSGEFFGRVDTPWNLFVKGYIGGGRTNNGHMNDEDFVIPFTPTFLAAYSNTLSSVVGGNTGYGVIDGGIDVLRGPGYKVGVFAGYFYFHQNMNAFGCTPLASINCTPPVPTSPGITEDDKWSALRIGIAAETMLTESVKLSGEVAYLPWVKVTGVDDHFFGNTGMLAEEFAGSGNGRGVQVEALLSYYLTPQFSIGVGGRYWAMWTTDATVSCTFGAFGLCGATPTPPQFFKAVVEQAGVIVHASYKFDASSPLVTK